MQYHFDGFRPGDPNISPRDDRAGALPENVDVLIVGCGPAGLTLAAQLAAFPDITTRIVERKSGPLEIGQADGIACRSMEMFEAFGFADKVAKEAYWVNETSFWRPGDDGILKRADRILDVEPDLSEMPHVILSQARIHDFYLEIMGNAARPILPEYDRALTSLARDDSHAFPCLAEFVGGLPIRARYVVGCDGARSAVRGAIGLELKGEAARQLWGVMDVLAVTDFPDIRLKAAIQSAEHGSIMVIPREGGAMVRLYIELDKLKGGERAADRGVTAETLIERARKIMAPYELDVKQVAWCSAYEIGQRLTDRFADRAQDPRIFIAGDACHTHSPKAGQGMNVSMADSFNLGWKLAHVLGGNARPDLLQSYCEERHAKAHELIEFDKDMARLFSAKSEDSAKFQSYFQQHGRFTAGVATRYDPSLITLGADHQHLAKGQLVGMRFHSAPVIRLGDAKPMELGHAFKADGRWRIVAFAAAEGSGIKGLCEYLVSDPASPVLRYTPYGADIDSVIDTRAVFQTPHREMDFTMLPRLLRPNKGRLGLTDYEKAFCPDPAKDIFACRGIDREKGAVLILRPDQYISAIFPLDDFTGISGFFERFMTLRGDQS